MLTKDELIYMAVLIQKFGNEDITNWMVDEMKIIEATFNSNISEITDVLREISYDHLLKKILYEIEKIKVN